jgi:hypothetical protein
LNSKTQAGSADASRRGSCASADSRSLTGNAFPAFATGIVQLARLIETLAPSAQRVGVACPQGREWFDLLQRKLLPQLQAPPLLIVAIVGGTNIGKSVIFNHLAGEEASAATPLAAGTKHPVCLVPPGCDDPMLLGRLFEHFELRAWQSADDPLNDAATDRIYWRLGTQVPERLVLVDAPDVDSDATVNWQRARAIRQTADVLIAILTQQKYNDAAVKQFFRAAVESDKPVVVIFNLCDLQADRDYWPQWLARFCAETGARPELIYVVPYDRAAAKELRLPFYRLNSTAPLGKEQGNRASSAAKGNEIESELAFQPPQFSAAPSRAAPEKETALNPPSSPTDLRNELGALHFDAIKIRTYRGALDRVLDPAEGLPSYLNEIRAAAGQFAAAASALSATEMARVAWPSLPTSVLVEEVQKWWDAERSEWSRRIHGFYRTIGRGVMRPVRMVWTSVAGPREDPLVAFQRQEQAAVVIAVEKLLDELTRLAQVGNEILQPRLQHILGGQARSDLLARIEAAHRSLPPIDEDYRTMLHTELDALKAGYPRMARWFQSLDQVLALARPVITVTLCISGGVLVGDLVGQAAVHAAGHVAGQVAADAAIATGITEAVVTTTGEGARQAAARLFVNLQSRFAQKRAQWLAEFLEKQLLGDLLDELRQGSAVPESIDFQNVVVAMEKLSRQERCPDPSLP